MMLNIQSPAEPLPVTLLVDEDQVAATYVPAITQRFEVRIATNHESAIASIHERWPAVVVLELALAGGRALDICRAVKSGPAPSCLLATTADVNRVPDALAADCDSVLLKPFPPNLLVTRLGLLHPAQRVSPAARALIARSARRYPPQAVGCTGTNRYCADCACPHCRHTGVTMFDFTSYRKAWYACLACRQVWVAAARRDW